MTKLLATITQADVDNAFNAHKSGKIATTDCLVAQALKRVTGKELVGSGYTTHWTIDTEYCSIDGAKIVEKFMNNSDDKQYLDTLVGEEIEFEVTPRIDNKY